jgi:sulfoxide reductase heme-binding subunit YedZ
MSPPTTRRDHLANVAGAGGVLAVSIVAGYVMADHGGSRLLHDKMLPWILSRCIGLGAYVSLSALVAVGIWFRHPWRVVRRTPGPEALLRAHAALAAATVILLAGHILAVCLDSYAGVGWIGTLVPWHSHYRPTATAVGSIAMYGIVVVAGTAALAGSIARRVWLPIHSISAVIFGLCLAHGLLAGSDSRVLWGMYAVTGAVVAVLQVSRMLARPPALAAAR